MPTNQGAVEHVVRLVLPALNVEPRSFSPDPGFVFRAQKRSKPSTLIIGNPSAQLVLLPEPVEEDPDQVVEQLATRALDAMSGAIRAMCERLVVAWGDQVNTYAAAFSISRSGQAGQMLASSWTPPESWPEPMIDLAIPADEAFSHYLNHVASLVMARASRSDFDDDLNRSLRLVDIVLLRHNGEGQDVRDRPPSSAPAQEWNRWLDRYSRSVVDEWRRVTGAAVTASSLAPDVDLAADGPLAKMTVFLSYARPDAATLARPVFEALRGSGAMVWFDQTRDVDSTWLDTGLADTIGACDAYVMCASDEFLERAGYATQEIAWALQQRHRDVRTKHFIVVSRPGTILPTAAELWPRVELDDLDIDGLARRLVDVLQLPEAEMSLPIPVEAGELALPWPSPEADLELVRCRVRHIRRFDEIPQQRVDALVTSEVRNRDMADAASRLLHVGEGLDWSGTFADVARWPRDPFVRGVRWRLAGSRAVASVRWPLTGTLDEPVDVADDVEFLVTTPLPVLDWEGEVGWVDNERRLAIRFHAGLLRVLQQLVHRGLVCGIPQVDESTLTRWEVQLDSRRQECYDSLIALRVQGKLSWKGEPPTWDGLYRAWRDGLRKLNSVTWALQVPAGVQLLLAANDDVAAVAAHVTWCSTHGCASAIQSFKLSAPHEAATVEIRADDPMAGAPDSSETDERYLRLRIVAAPVGVPQLELSWGGFAASSPSGSGTASGPAPGQLSHVLNLSRT